MSHIKQGGQLGAIILSFKQLILAWGKIHVKNSFPMPVHNDG